MQLDHQFTIPDPPDDVFALLLDVDRIAPCLPGAQLTGRDGDTYRGSIRVKVGLLAAAYEGTATIEDVDDEKRCAVLVATGSEVGGQGGADARVQLEVYGEDGTSEVRVHTDLDIRGRAAQFGRGVLDDVAGRIVEQFATNLQATLTARPTDRAREAAAAPRAAAPRRAKESVTPRDTAVAAEPLDLLAASMGPVVRRSLPYVLAALLGFLLGRLLSRRGIGAGAPPAVYVLPPSWPMPPGGPGAGSSRSS